MSVCVHTVGGYVVGREQTWALPIKSHVSVADSVHSYRMSACQRAPGRADEILGAEW